ncbi:MAG: serine hydrolase domain-containing protein, partial [Gaiellales bacterium]
MNGQTELTVENWLWDMHGTRSAQRLAEFRSLAPISRGTGPVHELPVDLVELDHLELVDRAGARVTLGQHLETSFTEGLIVIKDGTIIYERYLNGLQPDTQHLLASVTKSVTATVLGIAIGRGALRLDDRVGDIAPEFIGTSVEDATVGQVIDMTAGTAFSEVHDELVEPGQESDLMRFFRQSGTMPLGEAEPLGVLGLFRELGQAYPHGDHFEYRTPLTCVAGRILEVATSRSYLDLVSEDVWSRIGAEHDAAMVIDVGGFPFAGGGMTATLRDIARYGLAHLDGGIVAGEQVIPADWV